MDEEFQKKQEDWMREMIDDRNKIRARDKAHIEDAKKMAKIYEERNERWLKEKGEVGEKARDKR